MPALTAPNLSIVICTFGRPLKLHEVIAALAKQKKVSSKVEVIIVGASLAPETKRQILAIPRPAFLQIRVLEQTSSGLSRARNLGILKAKYEVVAFLDDDTVPVGTHWMATVTALFKKQELAVVCGNILLDPKPTKKWHKQHWHMLTYSYFGSQSRFLPDSATPPAAHLVIRRQILLQVGGFRPELGRYKQLLLSGEDDELSRYLNKIGHRIYFSAELVVRHLIPSWRYSHSFFNKRFYWQGVTDVLVDSYLRESSYPLHLSVISLVRFAKKSLVLRVSGQDSTYQWQKSLYFWGRLCGYVFVSLRSNHAVRPLTMTENV